MVIYLAGIEQKECNEVARSGKIPYAFYSYYYMRKKQENCQSMIDNREFHKIIFVDSGAHTFFAENHDLGLSVASLKKKTKTKETPEEYMQKYIEWLKVNIDHLDYFAELDIGEIVGQDKVMEWREQLKQNNLYHKCVTVYHPNVMSWEDYIAMLEDSQSGYIALEGDRDNRDRLEYNKLLFEAYERKVKVHGFAMTKTDVFFKYGFYSVDSSSWKSGVMYGTLSTFQKMVIKAIECKSYKDVIKIKGINLELLNHETYKINSQYKFGIAAKAFNDMSEFLTKVWVKRGVIW